MVNQVGFKRCYLLEFRQSSEKVPGHCDEDQNQNGQHYQQNVLPIKEAAKEQVGPITQGYLGTLESGIDVAP